MKKNLALGLFISSFLTIQVFAAHEEENNEQGTRALAVEDSLELNFNLATRISFKLNAGGHCHAPPPTVTLNRFGATIIQPLSLESTPGNQLKCELVARSSYPISALPRIEPFDFTQALPAIRLGAGLTPPEDNFTKRTGATESFLFVLEKKERDDPEKQIACKRDFVEGQPSVTLGALKRAIVSGFRPGCNRMELKLGPQGFDIGEVQRRVLRTLRPVGF